MSWLIDTKAISSLLKEAQKQIDKALDIKDDEGGEGAGEGGTGTGAGSSREESCEVLGSNPTTPGSELISPLSSPSESPSVEVICDNTTTSTKNVSSLVTSPDIEVFGSSSFASTDVESPDDDDDQVTTVRQPITTAPGFTSLPSPAAPLPSLNVVQEDKMNESNESDKTIVTDNSMEMFEIRTVSDSTTSFEEILPSIRPYQPSLPHKVNEEPKRKSSSGESNDEMETGTSSDIEIISSPSTANSACCRESPEKKSVDVTNPDKKGHFREPSEVSIQSTASEDSHFSSQSETEKLVKRINDLSEILEQREAKLLELGRRNSELMEQNVELQGKLREKDPLELSNVTEEYAQRMSALEKKFQQTIREKEAFRKELAAMKNEFVGKISKIEVEKSLAEKEEMISELRTEGDKLSKQILNYTNIIKKLRAKEKETDAQLKSQSTQIEELTEETDRLKKNFTAKEDVERSQIEAVHKLSSAKTKLEEENASLRSKNDDQTQLLDALKASLEIAKSELKTLKAENAEILKKLNESSELQAQNSETVNQNAQMSETIAELKKKWKQSEEQQTIALNQLRKENSNLLRQLEEAELRIAEQNDAYSLATVPLMKQIETLRNQMQTKISVFEKREHDLVQKLDEAQTEMRQFHITELSFKEKISMMKTQMMELETRLSETQQTLNELRVRGETQKFELEKEVNLRKQEETKNQELEAEFQRKIKKLEAKLSEAEERLKRKRIPSEDEDERTYTHHGGADQHAVKRSLSGSSDKRCSSPALSIDRMSMGESFSWQPDDLDTASQSGHTMLGFGSSLLHTTSLLENLQATIKQKDGEISQLHWELNQLKNERKILSEEVSKLSVELENLKENIKASDDIEKEFHELQTQYNALLTMYGEKIEESEELKLDLMEIKEMYKAQIDAKFPAAFASK